MLNLGLSFAALSDFMKVSSLFDKPSPAFSMPVTITVQFTVCLRGHTILQRSG